MSGRCKNQIVICQKNKINSLTVNFPRALFVDILSVVFNSVEVKKIHVELGVFTAKKCANKIASWAHSLMIDTCCQYALRPSSAKIEPNNIITCYFFLSSKGTY